MSTPPAPTRVTPKELRQLMRDHPQGMWSVHCGTHGGFESHAFWEALHARGAHEYLIVRDLDAAEVTITGEVEGERRRYHLACSELEKAAEARARRKTDS